MTVFGDDGARIDPDDDNDDTPLTDDILNDDAATAAAKQLEIETQREIDAGEGTVEVATRDELKEIALQEQWPHDYLQFEGDRLEVRLPTEQALSAFSISVSKYMPAEVQNDMVGLFISKHLSPESYTHVLARMMDPDEPTYTNKTIGLLMGAVSRAAIGQRKAAAEAEKAAEKAAAA